MNQAKSASVVIFALCFVLGVRSARAGDLRITIPRKSRLTPVQRLNREGVEQLKQRKYDKAEATFYKAYLYDPDDPFTLNNLGYASEMQGQLDRAQSFYALAAQQPTEAVIDRSNLRELEGRPARTALAVKGSALEINQLNVRAVQLISQARGAEADAVLQQALRSDPRNPFTLNNLAVAKEVEGDSAGALKYYDEVASLHSDKRAVVASDRKSRGRPISELAAESARRLRERLEAPENLQARVADLNRAGVAAVNRNDLQQANQLFRRAYSLDPNNAFALNNIGYVAELEGDRETAETFYHAAQQAPEADAKVGLASRRSGEGEKLISLADDNQHQVDSKVAAERAIRRQQGAPIVLKHRDNTPVIEQPASESRQSPANNRPAVPEPR